MKPQDNIFPKSPIVSDQQWLSNHGQCLLLTRMSCFSKQLSADLLDLIELVGEEINDKALCEGTTLVGCRAFPQGKNYWITGVNIGDSMLVGWDPILKTVYHLLPSRVTEAGTAIIPTAYRSFEVHTVMKAFLQEQFFFLCRMGYMMSYLMRRRKKLTRIN